MHKFCVRSISDLAKASAPRGDENSFYEIHRRGEIFRDRERERERDRQKHRERERQGVREWVVYTGNAGKTGRNSIKGRFQRFQKVGSKLELNYAQAN